MEGYIKATIGGEPRGFKFDLKSFGLILKDLETPLDKVQTVLTNPFLCYPVILFHGAKRAVEKEKEEVTFVQEDVFDWIEAEDNGVLSENILSVVKVFMESIVGLLPKTDKSKKGQAAPNVKKSTGSKT